MSQADREIPRAELEELEWRALVRDELRSLRTTMILLGVLGVVALGIAVWALLDDDTGGGGARRGASAARVAALERRIEALRSDVERAPPSSATASLRDGQQQVAALAGRLQKVEQADARLRDSLTALDARVDDLERAPAAPTPTATP